MTATPALALTTHTITSPNGSVNLTVTDEANGSLTYSVTAGTQTVFRSSPLGITTSSTDFTSGLSYTGETRAVINETYSLPAGSKPSYTNNGREMTLTYWQAEADELEQQVFATVSGNYRETIERGLRPLVDYAFTYPDGASSGKSRSQDLPAQRLKDAKPILRALPDGWDSWPRSASAS